MSSVALFCGHRHGSLVKSERTQGESQESYGAYLARTYPPCVKASKKTLSFDMTLPKFR